MLQVDVGICQYILKTYISKKLQQLLISKMNAHSIKINLNLNVKLFIDVTQIIVQPLLFVKYFISCNRFLVILQQRQCVIILLYVWSYNFIIINFIYIIKAGTIVSCSYDETIRVWNLSNGQCVKVFKEFKTSFNDVLAWNQEEIICCSDDKAIRLLHIQTGQMKMQLFDSCFVNGIARVSQNEIAVGNFKGEIVVINVNESKIVRRMGSHKSFVWRIKMIDKDLIASASFDKTIKIWEWQSGSLVASLEGHQDIVRSIELIEENGILVSTSDDKSIKVWRLI